MLIKCENLTKRVNTRNGELLILDNISISVEKGVSVAILGASGSGKTTLLGLLAGLDTPTSGAIEIDGRDITPLTEDEKTELRANKVGFVFQNFQLLHNMTALENVMLPLELNAERDPMQSASTLLEQVGLGDRLTHYPAQLSGGEQQRCAVARAFATRPSILFADEPTGNLDQETGLQIIDLLFKLNREKQTTLIMATHDPVLAGHCDQRLFLERGQLVDRQD